MKGYRMDIKDLLRLKKIVKRVALANGCKLRDLTTKDVIFHLEYEVNYYRNKLMEIEEYINEIKEGLKKQP